MRKYWIWIVPIMLTLFTTGCDSANTPEETTDIFWHAIKENDSDTVNSLIVPGSNTNMSVDGKNITRITTNEVINSNSSASVMTHLYILEDGKEKMHRFNTILVQQDNGQWKINAEDTVVQLMASMFKDLKGSLTEAFKQGMGDINNELRKKISAMQQANKNINTDNLDEELQQLGNELEKSLGAFGSAMADTIKKASKVATQEAIKGMESATEALEQELQELEKDTQENNN